MGLKNRRGTIVYEDSDDDDDDETTRLLRSVPPGSKVPDHVVTTTTITETSGSSSDSSKVPDHVVTTTTITETSGSSSDSRSSSIGGESILLEEPGVYKSRWRSIRVMYLTMFLSSVSFSICMSSLYPYLKVLDKQATTDFLGWVVAAYSLGQLFAAPLFGTWANVRKNSREPIIVSLTINIMANVLYMYLESIRKDATVYLVLARAFIGFGAGNAAVVRSYTAGATTLKERTPAMANMSACQAVGFIIGPVIQAALVPVGYPGPVHVAGFHMDLYTAPALLSVLLGVLNVVLIIFVFREHTITDKQYITSIQDTAEDVEEQSQHKDDSNPPDYFAVVSSIMLFFIVLFIFSIFETIATPISMHMFAWTKAQATLFVGLILGCAGVVSIMVFVVIKILSKRLNERYLMLGGFIICLFGFIAFLPWGHHYPSIQYADIKGSTITNSTNMTWLELPETFSINSNNRQLLSMINDIDDNLKSLSSNGNTTSTTSTTAHKTIYTNSTPMTTTTPTMAKTTHHTTDHSSPITKQTSTIPTRVITTESTDSPETTHSLIISTHHTTHRQDTTVATTESTTLTHTTVATTKSTTPTHTTAATTESTTPTHTTVATTESTTLTHTTVATTKSTTPTHTTAATTESTTPTHTTVATTESTTPTHTTVATTESTTPTHTTVATTKSTHTVETTHGQQTTESTTRTSSTVKTTHRQHTTEITSHGTSPPTTEIQSTTHNSSIMTTTSHTHDNTTAEATGCPYTYGWCFDTPAIALWQFILGTLLVSIGYPTCSVMSYTMYSKILGPKPQGVWMGWMTAAGSLSRTLGPVFVSQVYDAYGPRVTMAAICGVIVITIVGFLVVCKRLVPYKLTKVVEVKDSNGHVK